MSVEKEQEAGEEFYASMHEELGVYDNPKLAAYVDQIGRKLLSAAPNLNFEISFTVTDSRLRWLMSGPLVGVLPAGHIFIDRTFLAFLDNEAELAAVLAHEIGHVISRFWTREVQIFGHGSPCTNHPKTGMSDAEIEQFFFQEEFKADEFATQLLMKSGYNPLALATFLTWAGSDVGELNGDIRSDQRRSCLKTHPPVDERISRIEEIVMAAEAKETYLGRDVYFTQINGIEVFDRPPSSIVDLNSDQEITTHYCSQLYNDVTGRPYDEMKIANKKLINLSQDDFSKFEDIELDIITFCVDQIRYQNRNEEAAIINEKLIDLYRAKKGAGHPDTISLVKRSKSIFVRIGRYDLASEVYEQYLPHLQAALESEHASTISIMMDLASLYEMMDVHKQGERLEERIALYEAAVPLMQKTFGERHFDTLDAITELAELSFSEKGDAVNIYEKALQDAREDSDSVAITKIADLSNQAFQEWHLGRLQNALMLHEQALILSEELLGDTHPHTRLSAKSLSFFHKLDGDTENERKFWEMERSKEQRALEITIEEQDRVIEELKRSIEESERQSQ